MAHRREESATQPVALAQLRDGAHLLGQGNPFERERRLVDEAHQEWQPVRSHRLTAVLLRNAEDTQRLAACEQRLEEPFGSCECARASACRFLVIERPFGCRGVDWAKDAVRRDGGSKFDLPAIVR